MTIDCRLQKSKAVSEVIGIVIIIRRRLYFYVGDTLYNVCEKTPL